MPRSSSFTLDYHRVSNALRSQVLISQAFDPSETENPAEHGCKRYNAIWDTGATGSVITEKVVQDCGLAPIGVTEVLTAGGRVRANQYMVNVWLPNRVLIPNVLVTKGELEGISILIGMDIINQGDFAVTNKNRNTIFSYRHPSMKVIDFVKEAKKEGPTRTGIVGKNSPCPCGSGRKYKNCHGKK